MVLLAVKGQDTPAALEGLAAGPPDLAIACLQNGVDNERQVLRRTPNTYAVPVMLPGTYLEPGVVEASSAPITGILDVGRYPRGIDERAEAISTAFATSTFSSLPQPEVMRFKWSKLLMNLGNALEAAVGPIGRESELYPRARAEAEAVLAAAGIDYASLAEDAERRGDLIGMRRINGQRRGGGSTWQSLARGTGRVETDLLNGEIVLLGRLHGVPTPVNALLQDGRQRAGAQRRAARVDDRSRPARPPRLTSRGLCRTAVGRGPRRAEVVASSGRPRRRRGPGVPLRARRRTRRVRQDAPVAARRASSPPRRRAALARRARTRSRVPEVLAVSDGDGGDPPFLVLGWIDQGHRAADTDVALGRALAALHQATPATFGREDRRSTGSRGPPERAVRHVGRVLRDPAHGTARPPRP